VTLYNVRTRVIGRLWAATAEGALTRHERLLRECGHENVERGDAFESEPTDDPDEFV